MSACSRGRSTSLKTAITESVKPKERIPIRRRGSQAGSSGDSASSTSNPAGGGSSVLRSWSPASARQPAALLTSKPRRHASPMNTRVAKHKYKGLFEPVTMFPASVVVKIRVPFTTWIYTFSVDLRKFDESSLLLATLLYATKLFQSFPNAEFFPSTLFDVRCWLAIGEQSTHLRSRIFTHELFENFTVSVLRRACILFGFIPHCQEMVCRSHSLSRNHLRSLGLHLL